MKNKQKTSMFRRKWNYSVSKGMCHVPFFWNISRGIISCHCSADSIFFSIYSPVLLQLSPCTVHCQCDRIKEQLRFALCAVLNWAKTVGPLCFQSEKLLLSVLFLQIQNDTVVYLCRVSDLGHCSHRLGWSLSTGRQGWSPGHCEWSSAGWTRPRCRRLWPQRWWVSAGSQTSYFGIWGMFEGVGVSDGDMRERETELTWVIKHENRTYLQKNKCIHTSKKYSCMCPEQLQELVW